jgi:hypothetical protein
LGWSEPMKCHGRYNYYALNQDNFVLRVPKAFLLRTLRLARAELIEKKDKIRMEYEDQTLRFRSSEEMGMADSNPVHVNPVVDLEKKMGLLGETGSFSGNFNIDHLLELVEPIKETEVELRVALLKREGHPSILLVRTIERFPLSAKGKVLVDAKSEEAFLCEVTRFVPSKD